MAETKTKGTSRKSTKNITEEKNNEVATPVIETAEVTATEEVKDENTGMSINDVENAEIENTDDIINVVEAVKESIENLEITEDTAEAVDNIKQMSEMIAEVQDNKAFNEAVEAEPDKAEEFVKEELERLSAIEAKVKEQQAKKPKTHWGWNDFQYE